MIFKAILFDLDGTLLDTLEDLGNAVNRVLRERGYPTHPIDRYRWFVGDGSVMLIRRALPAENRDEATVNACHEAYLEDYGQNWKVKTRPYEGVSSMLDALTERGVKKAILSNKRHAFTRLCVKELLGRWKFEVVLGEREGVPRKPDPAGAIEAADFLKIPPSDFCYLGDTAVDMKTALGAGMFPIGVLWGFHPMEELKDSGARALLKRPLDILKLLDE